MAVYTQVSNEALDTFLTHYDVGRVLSFKGIAEGVENSNFLLRTTKASYILTLYEKRVHEEDLPFFLGLMSHMAQRGVTCPLPVAGTDGTLFRDLNRRPAALITFLEGVSVRHPTEDQARAVGEQLARFHLASDGFELSRTNTLGPDGWRTLFRKTKSDANKVRAGLSELIADELTFIDANWPQGLPTGVVHADLFPDNVFFLENDLSGIIDFYFACNDFFAYDLAICINAWCFDDTLTFLEGHGQAMIAGYQSVRCLGDDEANALPVLCRGAAMRFLLTRLHDWIHQPEGALVDPKNPLEFDKRLSFFQKAGDALSSMAKGSA